MTFLRSFKPIAKRENTFLKYIKNYAFYAIVKIDCYHITGFSIS